MDHLSLPLHRRAVSGRTYSSPWDAGTTGPGAAIERHTRRSDSSVWWVLAAVLWTLALSSPWWLKGLA